MDETVEMQIAEHLREIMGILGIERTEGNKETPKRIAKMWNREVFQNRTEESLKALKAKMKVFDAEGYSHRLLKVKDIPFSSMCEHHFMPFIGTVTVGYVPDEKIIGLSKIPRIVHYFSKRPQLQERFTNDVAQFLFEQVNALAVFVEVKAKHTCVTCRGIELPCETTTFVDLYDCDNAEALAYYTEFNKRG